MAGTSRFVSSTLQQITVSGSGSTLYCSMPRACRSATGIARCILFIQPISISQLVPRATSLTIPAKSFSKEGRNGCPFRHHRQQRQGHSAFYNPPPSTPSRSRSQCSRASRKGETDSSLRHPSPTTPAIEIDYHLVCCHPIQHC